MALKAGQEIRWRDSGRKWSVGYVVAFRGPWVVVRLPSGAEIEVAPRDIKVSL